MRIAAYVQSSYAKENYSVESFNTRKFAGLAVVIDILRRAGYEVEYTGAATVNQFDVVLLTVTADCDWWTLIAERRLWPKGTYKTIVGGAGALNIRPYLGLFDYFVLGRAEGIIDGLIRALDGKGGFESESVIESATFSMEKTYRLNQVEEPYPYEVTLGSGKKWKEDLIGCNHRCLFCGYVWNRKPSGSKVFEYKFAGAGAEKAIIDMSRDPDYDLTSLITTAIDGMSERLRFAVNKPITREMFRSAMVRIASREHPRKMKLYNIVGYPTETLADWQEFMEDLRLADEACVPREDQQCLVLHNTPFRPMPASPLACEPMRYENYRGEIKRAFGEGLQGSRIFQGQAIWAVESMGTEGLAASCMAAVAYRGTEADAHNMMRVAASKQFEGLSSAAKVATLERYFDLPALFARFNSKTLPTRNIKTYAKVEHWWDMEVFAQDRRTS